jgi:hypothetical protein
MKNREPFENYSPITRCLLKPLLGGAPVRDGYEVQAHAVA